MHLEELTEEHAPAFLEMLADYRSADPGYFKATYQRKNEWTRFEFRAYLRELAKQKLDWRPGPGKVSFTRYVMVNDRGELLANAMLRFPLDEITELDGGNITVDVPPSLRGRGHGSYCLALTLFEAVRAGMSRVLVTCRADDPASNRLIQKNRGVLENTVASPVAEAKDIQINRYWISFR